MTAIDIDLYIDELVATFDPLTRDEFREPERHCLRISMNKCGMKSLPEATGSGERCSGEMVCHRCGHDYYSHPMDWRIIGYGNVPFLINVLCDGERVKL